MVSGSHLLSGLPSHHFRDTWALWWRDSRGSWAAAQLARGGPCPAGQQRGEGRTWQCPRLPCAERCSWWRGRVDSAHRMPSRPAPSEWCTRVVQGPLSPWLTNSAFPPSRPPPFLSLSCSSSFLSYFHLGAFSRESCVVPPWCPRPCPHPRCNLICALASE